MRKKHSLLSHKAKNSRDIPITLELLDAQTGELRSEITTNRLEIGSVKKEIQSVRQEVQSVRLEVQANRLEIGSVRKEVQAVKKDVQALEQKMDSRFLQVDAQFEKLLTVLRKVQVHSEEQNTRNKVVMDCYFAVVDSHKSIESRLNQAGI